MEQRGTPVASLSRLDDLRILVDRPGPFLTVYLPLRPATEELAEATRLRWRELREDAATAGAPPAVLDVVDPLVEGVHRAAEGLCVVAAEDGPPLVEHLSAPPEQRVRWDQLPALVPLIEARQGDQPHVVVLVDRRGADIAVRSDGEHTTSVEGADYPLRKVAPGGWSQRRFQQRAEETWERNMAEVADELVPLVEKHEPVVVAVGGDERAVDLLVDELPAAIRDRVRRIEVTRATDGSIAQLDTEVDRVVTDWIDEQLSELLATYGRELGQDDRATTGARDTLAALRASRVATLLVPPAADDVDEAVVAALATGADVQVVPDRVGPLDEVGAILRW